MSKKRLDRTKLDVYVKVLLADPICRQVAGHLMFLKVMSAPSSVEATREERKPRRLLKAPVCPEHLAGPSTQFNPIFYRRYSR